MITGVVYTVHNIDSDRFASYASNVRSDLIQQKCYSDFILVKISLIVADWQIHRPIVSRIGLGRASERPILFVV